MHQEDLSLPGWVYHDPEYFRVEMARLIRPSWQIVCHANDIAERRRLADAGDARRERHRHPRRRRRGARLRQCLPPPRLAAGRRRGGLRQAADLPLSCLDLCRRRPPGRRAAPGGLSGARSRRARPRSRSSWRLGAASCSSGSKAAAPSVAEMMAPYEAEVAPHRFEELQAIGRITMRPRDVNWKNVADNYSDGLHIKVAHPGLTRLFGGDYRIEAGAACRPDVGRSASSGRRPTSPSAPIRHFLPDGAGRTLALFQALAERRHRHLSRPGRFHAFRAGRPDRDDDPRNQLRAARTRAAR